MTISSTQVMFYIIHLISLKLKKNDISFKLSAWVLPWRLLWGSGVCGGGGLWGPVNVVAAFVGRVGSLFFF